MREGTPAQVAAGQAQWSIATGDGPSGLLELGRVDHVVTDPQYESEAHSKGRRIKVSGGSRRGGIDRRGVREAPLDFAPMTEDLRDRTGAAIVATCSRWSLVFCQSEAATLWRDALAPMRHIRIGAWIKPDGQPQLSGDRPGVGWEAIEICHARGGRTRWNGGGHCAVWSFCSQEHSPDGRLVLHQTKKPVALMMELIRLFTDANDLVADPFTGSGTTVIACLALGRRCVGWEVKSDYADMAKERVRAWTSGNTVSSARAGQTSIMQRLADSP